jgi:hypothetical protein
MILRGSSNALQALLHHVLPQMGLTRLFPEILTSNHLGY